MARSTERLDALAALIGERGVVHLKDAARALGVSEMTIRRDISGEADRFAYLGGHIMPAQAVEPEQPYELSIASDKHAQAKRQACTHALDHLRAEDTIFVDCGSTLMHLADMLPDSMPLTVACYALNIAEKIAAKPNMRLIMLGGFYHPASASFSGAFALELLDQLGVNTAFLSAAGLDEERGATCVHFHEAEIKRKAMAVSRKKVLVLDTSKIGRIRPAFFAKTEEFDAIYTEDGAWQPEDLG
ncbi:DeoR/GlpR transcriptional regulator [Rhizobium sp. KVB221]|uniref:DeoR/GlpR transcriptional regulator n=1 Tax=Rhizobium setariae TaxID=2801340 RepID=A0A936YR47_9HYPH|nr:DeoR/GlpR family DNA-binding transcription regulator [Rhizobium setariae]MBL0372694.1 DeoR/GlpR transcriptional regulator [Rhizobium setariae]